MSISRFALKTVAAVSASGLVLAGVVAPTATASTGLSSIFGMSSVDDSQPTPDPTPDPTPTPDPDPTPGEGDGPKNIIHMIGDGMGYNHVAATNLYETGDTRYQVEGAADSDLSEADGPAVQVYEGEDWNQLAMSTFQHDNSYEPERAWTDHGYVSENYTDSAASGTALATGVKTDNGSLGVDVNDEDLENTSERAKEQDKAAGVVSSVPFSHATPAAWAAHNADRNAYHEIAAEMIEGDLDVIMGPGHPFYNNDNEAITEPLEGYMSTEQYEALANGETDFEFIEEDADFEALANGEVEEDTQYFGLPQVNSTLQHDRSGESEVPYDVELNDVVDLATMTEGALNVLEQDDEGFHLMVEGGAIDWAGHANDIARDIEEVQAFNAAVESVVAWVEEESSWDETLLIVTADHETGFLSGESESDYFTGGGAGEQWVALEGEAGEVPAHQWYSPNHTNMLVPIFFRGAGSEDIIAAATNTDPVRGDYVDNTTVADLTLNEWWARD